MKIKIVLVILFIFTHLHADSKIFQGEWEVEKYKIAGELPFSVFLIELEIDSKNNLKGNFCYIRNYGRKIDCDNKFTGIINNKKLIFNFNSSFGGKKGKASIIINENCTLSWQLIKNPDGEFYVPYKTILKVKKINQNNICTLKRKYILSKKQPLYKTPPQKTKMHLIKGDKVKILKEENDWLYILYKGKKDIKAWIPKSALDKPIIKQHLGI